MDDLLRIAAFNAVLIPGLGVWLRSQRRKAVTHRTSLPAVAARLDDRRPARPAYPHRTGRAA
jgi:hypothetical protein